MVEQLSVLILAGGRSRRMGQDKVWLVLDGQPLIERTARRVLPVAAEYIFSTNTPERILALMAALPVPGRAVGDTYLGAGPLAGLHAGLAGAHCDLVLALAADMPFVSLDLVRHLVEQAAGYDVVMPHVLSPHSGEATKEPLHALYRRSCLPAITAHLSAHDLQAFSFLPDVRVRNVQPDEMRALDPDLLSFFNVNTPEDWQRAQRLVSQHG